MSALATALVRLGDEVTGADRTLGTPNIRFLESLGVKVYPDDGSGVDSSTDEVIVSTAIEDSNAGLIKAKELGVPVTHRAKALSRTLKDYKLVAVVGTCGKSTVTAMLGHVLAECGLDPMCVNGANVPGWEGAVRFGKGQYAVAEVDESDKSLVAFKPYAAIVTNASADHYSKEEMDEVFDAFVKDCKGPVVDGRKGLGGLECLGGLDVPIPGKHNLQNAQHAVLMAIALGVEPEKAIAAMKTFRGVERRLQLITSQTFQTSKPPKPVVYDDYAHNPEKLKAMWMTLAEKHPEGICVIWRPHGYAPLRKMMDALAEMFAETVRPCDKLLLLPVYDAGGTTDRSVNSDELLRRIGAIEHHSSDFATQSDLRSVDISNNLNNRTIQVADLDAAYAWCVAHKGDYAAFVTCGARDPGLPVLARRLSEM